jgi:hypothetical protein
MMNILIVGRCGVGGYVLQCHDDAKEMWGWAVMIWIVGGNGFEFSRKNGAPELL